MRHTRVLHKHSSRPVRGIMYADNRQDFSFVRETDTYGYMVTVDAHVQITRNGGFDCYSKELGLLGFSGKCEEMVLDMGDFSHEDIVDVQTNLEKYPVSYDIGRYVKSCDD